MVSSILLDRLTLGVRIVLALAFCAAGVAKLFGVQEMVQIFTQIGLGQWFRFLTGGIEIIGALLIVIPGMGFFGALSLAATMIGAVITHLFVIGGSPIPAIALGLLSAVVAYRLAPCRTANTKVYNDRE